MVGPFLQVASIKHGFDEVNKAVILNFSFQEAQQEIVIHGIEVRAV